MATASIKPPASPPTIVLELTIEEAATIRDIAHKVSGHPATSRRGVTDRIMNALGAVDSDLPPLDADDIAHGLRFADEGTGC